MDQQSLFFTSIVAICATTLMLIFILYFAKRKNIKIDTNQKVNISYAVWIISIMIAFFLYLKPALELVENSIETIIYSTTIDNTFIAVLQKIMIFTGFTYIFTFLSYFVTDNIAKLLMGNRLETLEMEKENIGFFLIKGILLIGLVFTLTPIFQHFLNWFMPVVNTPFYH